MRSRDGWSQGFPDHNVAFHPFLSLSFPFVELNAELELLSDFSFAVAKPAKRSRTEYRNQQEMTYQLKLSTKPN